MTEYKRIGKYEIIRELGRGGFATVYEARDTTLNRIVALKVLHSQPANDIRFIQRFQQEASIAANLDHPHIVTIYEVGEDAGQHYLAMTLLPGQTLDELLANVQGPLLLEQTVSIVEQIAGALDYVHERGLVHRDVKPSNIIVDDTGQSTLLDFGIVRAADGTALTTIGTVMGTPQYMSPEQAEGGEVDARSDVYSLGVVAYQICTGQVPFDAESPLVVIRLHADKQPLSPRKLNPQLPVEVGWVLIKALAKKPEERYQSAGELAQALRQAIVEAKVQSWQRAKRLIAHYRQLLPTLVWIAGGVAVIVTLITLSGVVKGMLPIESTITPTLPVYTRPTPTSTNTPTLTPQTELCIGITRTGARYYVYPDPDLSSNYLGTVAPEWRVRILDQTRDKDGALWYKIDYGDEDTTQVGWIPARHIIEVIECPRLP